VAYGGGGSSSGICGEINDVISMRKRSGGQPRSVAGGGGSGYLISAAAA